MSLIDFRPICLSLLILLCVSSAYAQTAPDAGALRQQIEQQLPQTLPGEKKPLTALPPAYKPAPGLSVTVKEFRFSGNAQLTAAQLASAVAPFINRPLDFAGLQQAVAAISDAYRAAGWLVRVYLPKQDITEGIVTIQVVEGLFGKVRFGDGASLRFSKELAQKHISATQPTGQVINAAALDRALLVLDDLPGVAVSGNLGPGEKEAETDLILKLADEPLFNVDIGLDNTGARATGEERLTANAYLNSPLKIGDQLSTNFIHSEGTDYVRLAYSLPVGHDGLRLGANASRMEYDVITSEFKAANLEGSSTSFGLDAQYPLIRSRSHNLYLSAAYDDRAFDNKANGATSTNYDIRNFTIGLAGNQFDKLGGGGANMASLNITAGEVDLDGSPNKTADAATTDAQGSFTKLRYALSRQQAITSDLSMYGLLSGQLASKNLDSAEKFYLGGANGVRAYPVNEGGGSEGSMLNLELRWRAMNNLVVTGFYDWGSVKINKDNSFAGAPALNRYQLDGVGASVGWVGPGGLSIKGTYAHRLGNNPNRDATTGNDQDGSLDKDRFWITASLPFSYSGSAEQKVAPVSITPTPAVPVTPVVPQPEPVRIAEPQQPTPVEAEEATSDDVFYRDLLLIADGLRFDSARLTKANKIILDDFIATDTSTPSDTILVIGHTDSIGSREYNQLLSLRRAISAQKYLVKKGIDIKRIVTRGDSEDHPVASNATKQGRLKNRRIEVKVTTQVSTPEK